MTQEEYFAYIEKDGIPVLSSSLMKSAIPVNGGCPERIELFFQKQKQREMDNPTPGMQFGTLIHAYSEDPTRFRLEPDWDVSDKIRAIADSLHAFLLSSDKEIANNPEEHFADFITIANELDWGKSWKAETRMKKFMDSGLNYWQFLKEAEGMIVVTSKDADKFTGVIESIRNSNLEYPVLESRANVETHREKALLFMIEDKYPAKILLDILEIDHEKKLIVITDTKTTSKKIHRFISGYNYHPDDESGVVKSFRTIGDYISYQYYIQEFFYRNGVMKWKSSITDLEDYSVRFQFAVIETEKPYLTKMVQANNQWMAIAKHEYDVGMANIKKWLDSYGYDNF